MSVNEPGDNKQEVAAIVGHHEGREGGRGRWESLPRTFLVSDHSGLMNSHIKTHYLKDHNRNYCGKHSCHTVVWQRLCLLLIGVSRHFVKESWRAVASTPNDRRSLCHASFKTYIWSNKYVSVIVVVVVHALVGLDFTFLIV